MRRSAWSAWCSTASGRASGQPLRPGGSRHRLQAGAERAAGDDLGDGRRRGRDVEPHQRVDAVRLDGDEAQALAERGGLVGDAGDAVGARQPRRPRDGRGPSPARRTSVQVLRVQPALDGHLGVGGRRLADERRAGRRGAARRSRPPARSPRCRPASARSPSGRRPPAGAKARRRPHARRPRGSGDRRAPRSRRRSSHARHDPHVGRRHRARSAAAPGRSRARARRPRASPAGGGARR